MQNLIDDFFSNSDKEDKPAHVPVVKKNHHLERAHFPLDHPKTLVFSDVIKVKILFKYSRHSYLFLARQKNYTEPP